MKHGVKEITSKSKEIACNCNSMNIYYNLFTKTALYTVIDYSDIWNSMAKDDAVYGKSSNIYCGKITGYTAMKVVNAMVEKAIANYLG